MQVRPDVDEAMTEHERRGRTAVLVAIDSEYHMKSNIFLLSPPHQLLNVMLFTNGFVKKIL